MYAYRRHVYIPAGQRQNHEKMETGRGQRVVQKIRRRQQQQQRLGKRRARKLVAQRRARKLVAQQYGTVSKET
jgi:hypothetical protein